MGAKPLPNLGEVERPPPPRMAIPVAAIIANAENRRPRMFKDKFHIDDIDERKIRNYRLPILIPLYELSV